MDPGEQFVLEVGVFDTGSGTGRQHGEATVKKERILRVARGKFVEKTKKSRVVVEKTPMAMTNLLSCVTTYE